MIFSGRNCMQKAGGGEKLGRDGECKNYALENIFSSRKKADSLPLKVSVTLAGFHLTTEWILVTHKDTVFILNF